MLEIWKPIRGYEGLYEISNLGRVKSLSRVTPHNGRTYPTKILKPHVNTKHYLDVDLCRNGVQKRHRIHRLVAEAFIPNPNNKPQVNHIDCDKNNNCVDNLEWCDNSENQIHAFKHGLNHRGKFGESPRAKSVLQYTIDGVFVKEWDSIIRIKKEQGYSDGYISQCCKGVYNHAYGYIWKYKEADKHGMEI